MNVGGELGCEVVNRVREVGIVGGGVVNGDVKCGLGDVVFRIMWFEGWV